MRVVLIKGDRLKSFILPNSVIGNYWITDTDENQKVRNLVNIESADGKWILKSNFEVSVLFNGSETNQIELSLYKFYGLKILESESALLYVEPTVDNSYISLSVTQGEYLIGNTVDSDISYNFNNINDKYFKISYQNSEWSFQILNDSASVFLNNIKVSNAKLKYGDILFCFGLKIIVMKDYILLNQIGNLIQYGKKLNIISKTLPDVVINKYDEEMNLKPIYTKDDYFHKSPRFKTIIEHEDISIDAPPTKENDKEMPALYTIGPMLTMSMTSLVFAISAIDNMKKNNSSMMTVVPTIVIAIAMVCSTLLWPMLIKKYQKKEKIKREKERQTKYNDYIEEKRNKINLMMKMQSQILKDNYISSEECANIILNKKSILWNRNISDEDFLSLRVGVGDFPLDINVKYKEEDFMMEDDELKLLAEKLVNETRLLERVPIGYAFDKKFISGIVGTKNLTCSFLKGLILQVATFYSYEQVKIVFMTNENNSYLYEYLKILPHIFNNNREIRFFATGSDEKKELSLYLEKIFQSRSILKENDYKNIKDYYLFITDDYESVRDLKIVSDILEQDKNYGFSMIVISEKLSELPNECKNFISIGEKSSGIFESEVSSLKQQEFNADFVEEIDIDKCFKTLANIPVELYEEESNLPKKVGFLEMYNVGMVEQLNITNRYLKNDVVQSLRAPVGVDKVGELLYLDLHEKAHGPHGLIAGMTGSGKSEFIITYILSMAVNYSPDDVAFVLIDYKGGGLAGAFENKETKIRLPHLAGTITNLDVEDMNRALVSIQSELRRRQAIFNKARDRYSESTIDIYKYQTLFKEGKVEEPVPHLIIISDEFAELKAQQPEFMDQLVSTARIGRSLGVHLVLATQKPSGVVNEQIWSNSKFKVCLKVQEKNDSMEMIKTPDAAELKNVGRFYLQVGYNELFILGQSAYSGSKYYPTEKLRKKVDTSVNFINNIGTVIKSIDEGKAVVNHSGEEITNVLKYISASCNGKKATNLWLDKIPEVIFVDDLKNKYSHAENSFLINPIIGEYDDPNNQSQGLYTLNISECFNTIIYGMAGSGKELFLSTLLYSIITNHSPNEVNIYILDCGTESLKIFNKAPHIGDVLSINDDEKIDKLLKMLEKEIEYRKEKFADYAGDYNVYIKNSPEKLPMIVTILNNYENFAEGYEQYIERLNYLVREGTKYGIITIVSAASPNSLRYKVRQNFKNELTLQLSDFEEYYNVFGRFDKKYLSNYKGRGLVKLDDVYEFQVACPYEEAELSTKIKDLCLLLEQKYPVKAKAIPVLPKVLSLNNVKNHIRSLRDVPVGINKDNLNIETFDFRNKGIPLITGQDFESISKFLNEFVKVISNVPNTSLITIDAEEIITSTKVYNDNFDDLIVKIYNKIKVNSFTNNCVCIIIGVDSLLGKISIDTKNKLLELFDIDQDINNFSIIFADLYTKFKRLEFETWYKKNVNNNNGIWIGNGIVNQYTIAINKIQKEHRDDIPLGFGYVVISGRPILVKLLEHDISEDIEVIE